MTRIGQGITAGVAQHASMDPKRQSDVEVDPLLSAEWGKSGNLGQAQQFHFAVRCAARRWLCTSKSKADDDNRR